MNDGEATKSAVPTRRKLASWRKPKVLIPCATLIALVTVGGVAWCGYHSYEEDQRLDAESVTLKDVRTIEVGEIKKVSDFLENLNGTLVEDLEIAPETIGDVEVSFDYINIKNKRRNIKFKVKAVDTVAPKIYGGERYTVNLGYQGDLTNLMLSGDNVDDNPKREIAGEYDIDRVGRYKLEYVITDASGNQAKQPFTLNVVRANNAKDPVATMSKISLRRVIRQFKNENTKVGIDVSEWQGEIDWQRVKDAGVEFAFIRVGYQTEFGGEYVLDSYFRDNLRAANEVGLETGVYFYSYAGGVEEAQDQARWVKSQIGGFAVSLGVAFDWESWSEFNGAGMSFRKINKVAEAFMDEISGGDTRYEALLYSSKTYLDKIWTNTRYVTWLAQYYDEPTYSGDYQYWQMTNTGQVDGIYGDVDIDIMYLGKEN